MLSNFLADLRRLGVQVWAEDGQLRYRAPARTLTHDVRAELLRHKSELLALLERGSGPRDSVLEHVAFPVVTPCPDKRHEPFPLTDIQHAYWVGRGSGFDLGNVATHAYFEFENAHVDVDRLNVAWQQLIARHDMMRAVVMADGQQRILPVVPAYQIAVTDLRSAPAADVQVQTDSVRDRMAHQVYDPARWPLFEVRITRLPGARVRVHVSIDLLIAEVWSLFLLFREWGALYDRSDQRLPPLTLSFRDYVLAEAVLEQTPRYVRARTYWTARVPELRPGPELPLAQPPAAITKPRFVRRSARIEAERWQRINARARQEGLTPTMVLCTAFTEVLAAWSKAPQFTLNVTLFHRLPVHPEVNAIVGDFTSTVLLAVDGGGAASFAERARRVQQQLWNDLEHRYVSGVRVLRDLARQAGRRITMPVVFTSTLGHEGGAAAPATWLGDLVYGISQTPQVWLDHQVGEDGDALVFNWDAVEALFSVGVLDAMFDAYCTRLEGLAIDEAAWDARTPPLRPDGDVRLETVDCCALPSLGSTYNPPGVFVAPRDDLERQLSAIWEDVLAVHPIGVTDRFFDVGGNSFLAVRLMVRVQQALGRTLPVSTLFQADDIASLARVIREQQPPSTSTLVRLASGPVPAFFCVHPIGGNVMCYVDLARCLGDRAFYGIQAQGLHGEAVPSPDVSAMAAHYLDEIRTVQPRGPYLLGGWSMGGAVAFEMARQLDAQGEVTRLLVLIDAETSAVAASGRHAVREPDLLSEVPADVDPYQLRHVLDVVTNNDRALKAYRERPYSGPVTLFRAREQPDRRPHDLGWDAVVTGGARVHVVPGDHYTMLQRPNVELLASELRLCLEAAAADIPTSRETADGEVNPC